LKKVWGKKYRRTDLKGGKLKNRKRQKESTIEKRNQVKLCGSKQEGPIIL
jgi:hypothetical protein